MNRNKYPGAMSDTGKLCVPFRSDWQITLTASRIFRLSLFMGQGRPRKISMVRTLCKTARCLEVPEPCSRQVRSAQAYALNTALEYADWDESRKLWRIGVSGGDVLTARYLITALGLLSRQNYPDIKGIDTFRGEMTHSAKWPKGFTVDNKRVGIIGSGSTGIQIMTDIAKKVKSLTSFQRHPQYTVISGDGPVSPEYRKWVNENYDRIFEGVRHSMFGFGIEESKRPLADAVSEEERDAIFQDAWDKGNGFRFMFGTFCDITTNPEANEAACKFIRKKIGEIVKDPVKAKKLEPQDIYARRPLCDGGYFEQFNGPNVDIVDLREVDIVEITPQGIKTSDGVEHELDVLIFDTGFDAVDGNYTRLRIHGRDAQTLKDRWETHGPRSFLGMFNPGFPNFINLAGPKGPFANFPPILEAQIEFVTTCIDEAEKDEQVIEATEEADQQWSDYCDNLAKGSLFWSKL